MLDGINALIRAFGFVFAAMFNAPLYDRLTWGMFLVSAAIIGIMIKFFVQRLK